MPNAAAKYNLLIQQGSTFRKPFSFRHAIHVKRKVSATQLEIRPLSSALLAGVELSGADDLILEVTANAAQGDRVLTIANHLPAIANDTVLGGAKKDLTGTTIRSFIRKAYNKPVEAEFVCTVLGSPQNGDIEIELPASITAALKQNCTWEELPENIQDRSQIPEDLYLRGYVWDLETVLGTTVSREIEGRVFITPEATRPS